MARAGRTLLAAAAAAAVTAVARRATQGDPPGGADRWTRTNHRGEPISLLEGPAVAAGLAAGALVGARDRRTAAAAVLATVGGGAFGLVDDLAEDTSTRTKGFRGHLGALAQGRLTTGGLKILGIGTTSLLAAAVGTRRTGGRVGHLADVAINGSLVALGANLLNLLDLRPGRALKAATAASLPLASTRGGALTGAVVGSAAAAAPGDLGERDMLGDGGANALGALVGLQCALGAPRPVRLVALAGVAALTVASEKVSFSAVIDRTPALRAVDLWGRRAPQPAAGHADDAADVPGVAPVPRG